MSDDPKKRQPSPEHIAAMGRGRKAAAAVSAYLEALEQHKPKRGRRVSPEELERRLDEARATAESAGSALHRLNATQEIIDLEKRLKDARAPKADLSALELGFVEWAAGYAQSKGITYEAFRSVGVPAQVLKKAGISR